MPLPFAYHATSHHDDPQPFAGYQAGIGGRIARDRAADVNRSGGQPVLRILQTPPRYFPDTGGVENTVLETARGLVARGHVVDVLCGTGKARRSARLDGVTVRRLRTPFHVANTPITPTLPWHLLTARYDIVHAHLPTPWSADWPSFIGRIRRLPSVITYNNEIIGRGVSGGIAALYRGLVLPLTLAAATRIIVSTERYREISPLLRRQRHKTRVIPYGVDSERFAIGSSAAACRQTIFFLAVLDQFHSYKGLDDLLAAVSALRTRLPSVRLVVGGAGNALAAYRAEAERLGVADITDFVGFISDEDLPRYYQEAAVFCLPSTSSMQEGFGLVLLEAMSCGTPVVTTDVVGMAPEIRDAAAGMVVPPRNPSELACALEAMLADRSRREDASHNARQLVLDKFTWTRVLDQTIELYRECL